MLRRRRISRTAVLVGITLIGVGYASVAVIILARGGFAALYGGVLVLMGDLVLLGAIGTTMCRSRRRDGIWNAPSVGAT